MKPRCSKLVRFLSILSLAALWAVAPPASAQSPPSLGLRFSAGKPTLNLTGTLGTVYSIQYATGLSPMDLWVDRTLLQAQGASNVWSDPSTPTPSQRFYRAVPMAAPADTNLVFIQPGSFTMGSPTSDVWHGSDERQHTVVISRGFWMGKHLVTQGDYLSVVGSNPSYFTSANGYSDNLARPVEFVYWFDATNYCALRTQQEQSEDLIPTNYVYRLPTESEWEYACRAGTTTEFYTGSSLDSGKANFDGQIGQTTPVGSYPPNPWGLYDMIGNVWEWCQDWYGAYPAGTAVDPQGAITGEYRTIRGGSWATGAGVSRSAYRGATWPENRGDDEPGVRDFSVGFRVVLAPRQP